VRILLSLGVLGLGFGAAGCLLERTGLEGDASVGGGGGVGGSGGMGSMGGGIPAGCGDGVVDEGEACDDGRTLPDDGCAPQCQLEEGFTCSGEPSVCVPTCGDGLVKFPEVCDDGGTAPGDGCADACQVEAGYQCYGQPSECSFCGDGQVTGHEECEDGNLTPGDGCDSACLFEHSCQNGIVEPTEQCDDGNATTGDGCSNACQFDGPTACLNAMDISDAPPPEVTVVGNVTTVLATTTGSPVSDFGDIEMCAPLNEGMPAVLHRYVIGDFPARLGIRTVDVGSPLYDTVVSVYGDCLSGVPIACDDDAGSFGKSRLSTEVLPAGSTVTIAVTGYYAGDVGNYHLEVIEQRAPLTELFETNLGLFSVEDGGVDGRTWGYCDPAAGCAANTTPGSGAYALASDNPDGDMLAEHLVSPPIYTEGANAVRVQFSYAMAPAGAVSDFGELLVSTDQSTWSSAAKFTTPSSNTAAVDITSLVGAATKFWIRFSYSDGGGDADTFRVDDVRVTFF